MQGEKTFAVLVACMHFTVMGAVTFMTIRSVHHRPDQRIQSRREKTWNRFNQNEKQMSPDRRKHKCQVWL